MYEAVTSRTATIGGNDHQYLHSADLLGDDWESYPVVLRLLAENVARRAEGQDARTMLSSLRAWMRHRTSEKEIHFSPGRLLMHDTTSTPALVDIAAMRDTVARGGGDPRTLNPSLPVEVSVDHSLAVEVFARPEAPTLNLKEEIRRNRERYRFLKWASSNMDNIHINPPGTGIMHTINLEQLATVTEVGENGLVFPDMMLGTDSHTPMINAVGVLGWGIGGLEAETVMFGMPTTLRIPDVVGVELVGELGPGVTATDLALLITHRLRELGVAGAFVEFFGPGVSTLSVGSRAVVANMAPEYGATTGFFPVDSATIDYLRMTGRSREHCQLVEQHMKLAGLWFDPDARPGYTTVMSVDLAAVTVSAAGPRRPQDQLSVAAIPGVLAAEGLPEVLDVKDPRTPVFPVAIASITSCTNTTDPRLLIAAGLLARKARERGLSAAPWVKTSLAPGSPAALSYLGRAGLTADLSAVGFDVVGFGCTTCIGNSGPLPDIIAEELVAHRIKPVATISGNRNFPSRIHPDLELGFLMSPPMVVAYALAGDASVDVTTDSLGVDIDGRDVFLADLWPAAEEIDAVVADAVDPADFRHDFQVASQNRLWHDIKVPEAHLFPWDEQSTMLRPPPFADGSVGTLLGDFKAHPLLVLGDDITTDHISPASAIPADSFIADFLVDRGEDRGDLNVFASRRGNWEVMARGAYYSKAVVNRLVSRETAATAVTQHGPSGELMSVWDASRRYAAEETPVVVIAGQRYGMGSSRDWAAKVQHLLGVRAVLAASYERIHRSNLVGMGILPLLLPDHVLDAMHGITAAHVIHIAAEPESLSPRGAVDVTVTPTEGPSWSFTATAALETHLEVDLLKAGGVIPTILRSRVGG